MIKTNTTNISLTAGDVEAILRKHFGVPEDASVTFKLESIPTTSRYPQYCLAGSTISYVTDTQYD